MHMADALLSPAVGGILWPLPPAPSRTARVEGAEGTRRPQGAPDGGSRRLSRRARDDQISASGDGVERPPRGEGSC